MKLQDRKILLAVGLWVVMLAMFAPAVIHLYSLTSPEPDVAMCYPEFNPQYSGEAFEDRFKQFEQVIRQNLAQSDDPNAQLMHVLVQGNGRVTAGDIDTIGDLRRRYPDNGLIAGEFILACARDLGNAACSNRVIGEITERHGDNSAIWGSIAQLNQLRGDPQRVRAALRQALAAPQYNDYLGIQFATLNDAIPDDDPLAKAFIAFTLFNYADYSIGVSVASQSLTGFCSEQAGDDTVVAELCHSYGERMATGADSLMGKMLGYAVQEVTFQATGDGEAARRIQQAGELLRDANPLRQVTLSLISYDEEFAEFWIDSLIEYGEADTQGRLYAETQRRLEDPDYQPCESPGLHFDFPYFYFGEERITW